MNVLVIGAGAREHAIAWKLSLDPSVRQIHAAPGNPGIARVATVHPVNATDGTQVATLARRLGAALVVIGPEAPLVAGVADALTEAGIPVFGPSRAAAAIEGSKIFAKDVMSVAGIPTAESRVFEDASVAAVYAHSLGAAAIKIDGLAGGKGVIVANSPAEAWEACHMLAASYPGQRLLVEERLIGDEVSIIALCDGERFVLLPPSQDHKQLADGDRGPNTGGMGAYAPATFVTAEELETIGKGVIGPTLRELTRRGTPFVGALYAGLMRTSAGVRVLEFNARFGDPETQPLMMLIDIPLGGLLLDCATGKLTTPNIPTLRGYSVGVVLAARGYPGSPETGCRIEGLDKIVSGPDLQVFHGGTGIADGGVVSAGGRVLTVCARGATLLEARDRAYSAASRIHFAGMHFRKDIGARRAL